MTVVTTLIYFYSYRDGIRYGPEKFGDLGPPKSKLLQPLDFIKFSAGKKPDISGEIVENYRKGLSLSDIATLFGCSKSKVLRDLRRHGAKPRPKLSLGSSAITRYRTKVHCKPYFGFCYSEGQMVKHPVEFPTLRLIHRGWRDGWSIHQIVCDLNKKKIKSRQGRKWSWSAVRNIVTRFENKNIILHEGGDYEFR